MQISVAFQLQKFSIMPELFIVDYEFTFFKNLDFFKNLSAVIHFYLGENHESCILIRFSHEILKLVPNLKIR